MLFRFSQLILHAKCHQNFLKQVSPEDILTGRFFARYSHRILLRWGCGAEREQKHLILAQVHPYFWYLKDASACTQSLREGGEATTPKLEALLRAWHPQLHRMF